MIASFTAFDIGNLIAQAKRVFLPVLLVIVLAEMSPFPVFAVVGAAMVVSFLASTPFASDERGRLDTLYDTLPITRSAVVVGRYLTLLALYAASAIVAAATSLAVAEVRRIPLDPDLLAAAGVLSFIVVAIALSVQLPFFFAVGYTRARPMTYLPILVMVAPFAIVSQTGLLTLGDIEAVVSGDPVLLGVLGGLAAAAALVVSGAVSRTLYIRREL